MSDADPTPGAGSDADSGFDFHVEVAAFLAQCRTATLATAGADGAPHAANVQFAADERLCFYFVSNQLSFHSRHVAERREVAMAIYAHDDAPERIHGLQAHGLCTQLQGEERAAAWRVYSVKFPFVTAAPYLAMVEKQAFYRVEPTWMRWIDNRRGFGWKREVSRG